MPPKTANFKTYEAQARLVAAIVAAHPDLRLNYKAIAKAYGGNTTTAAIEHRFRPVKEQAKAIKAALDQDQDPGDLNLFQNEKLARVFGESTPDGLSFQFRTIKKQADALKQAADSGGDPVAAFRVGAPATPSTKGTPGGGKGRKQSAASTGGSTPGPKSTGKRKASQNVKYKEEELSVGDEEDLGPVDYEDLDATPTKVRKVTAGSAKKQQPASITDQYVMSGGLGTSPTASGAAAHAPSGHALSAPSQQAPSGAHEPTPSESEVETPGNTGFLGEIKQEQSQYDAFASDASYDIFGGLTTYSGDYSEYGLMQNPPDDGSGEV